MSDAAFPLGLLALAIGLVALALRGGAASTDAGRLPEWFWRLPPVAAALSDPGLGLMMKQAGRLGTARLRQFLLIRMTSPLLAVLAGVAWLALVPGTGRSAVWGTAFLGSLAAIGHVLPNMHLRWLIRQRKAAFRQAWPDALDLMLLAVEAGLGLDAAIAEVARRMERHAPVLAAELRQTLAEIAYLSDRRQAFSNLSARVDLPAVSIVTAALIQAERYGTPVADALRAMARDTRATRMAEAERRASSLPPRLTVPMIIFFLPVLFAVIFTPGIILYLTDL